MSEAGQEDLLQVKISRKWTLSANANYPGGYARAGSRAGAHRDLGVKAA